MTPDELFTRLFKQQAELNAARLAMDALMVALPKDQQQLWLQALKSLAANQAALLGASGAGATAAQGQIDAVARQLARLEGAPKAVKRADGAN